MMKTATTAFAEYRAEHRLFVCADKGQRITNDDRYARISYTRAFDLFAAGWKAGQEAMKK